MMSVANAYMLKRPLVVASATCRQASGSATFTASLPSGIRQGDYILVFCRANRGASQSSFIDVSGWTRFGSGPHAIYWKKADGTEGATADFTNNTADATYKSIAILVRGAVRNPVQGSNANAIDPLTVTASWTGDQNLFIASISMGRTDNSITTPPTGYGDMLMEYGNTEGSASEAAGRIVIATKESSSNTDDPDTFSGTGALTNNLRSRTIVIG